VRKSQLLHLFIIKLHKISGTLVARVRFAKYNLYDGIDDSVSDLFSRVIEWYYILFRVLNFSSSHNISLHEHKSSFVKFLKGSGGKGEERRSAATSRESRNAKTCLNLSASASTKHQTPAASSSKSDSERLRHRESGTFVVFWLKHRIFLEFLTKDGKSCSVVTRKKSKPSSPLDPLSQEIKRYFN